MAQDPKEAVSFHLAFESAKAMTGTVRLECSLPESVVVLEALHDAIGNKEKFTEEETAALRTAGINLIGRMLQASLANATANHD